MRLTLGYSAPAALALVLIMVAGQPLAAAERVLPDNLASATTGEWAVMRDVAGETEGELTRYSVVETRGDGDDRVVVMRRERYDDDGAVAESRDIEIPVARYRQRLGELEDKAKQVSREKLTVKGNEIAVYAVTWDHRGEDGETREMKIWLAPSLPVGGLVKSWSDDPAFPASELVDFGEN